MESKWNKYYNAILNKVYFYLSKMEETAGKSSEDFWNYIDKKEVATRLLASNCKMKYGPESTFWE